MREQNFEGVILIVDDDKLSRALHRKILAKHYDVVTASSGREALELFDAVKPDLVLMDAVMPDLDGYQTSVEIRKHSRVPIIFVTANTSLEEHLKAYESGGTGLLTKPVNSDYLTKKVSVSLERYSAACKSEREKSEFQLMAMSFLSSAGQSGALLNFMRTAIAAPTYEHLGKYLLEATQTLNLNCVIRIQHGNDSTVQAYHGDPTPLEISIIENAAEMGRIFQFKNRLVVNYDRITVVVSNAPSDETSSDAGTVRDNLAILAEAAQALAEGIDIRRIAAHQAEQMQMALSNAEFSISKLRDNQHGAMADVQILLHNLVDNIEKSYSWLNTTQAQESEISRQMEASVKQILARLGNVSNFEEPLEQVIQALRDGYNRPDSVEMF